ncbi:MULTISPECIES: phage holin family protein [Streptomyces]|uniref:Phage holin family protein n=1 Tax=Streptomyces fuscus TaxID=3048495 RepID=A0ABT7IWS6_9ACTN|nr:MULTISPECIES: phage holin family protein [Streptomyces]MCM1975567.1 phage holin family protein [Streptomyces sp. G1]MDL2077049.1 phage holin family protein [Streptomyces fuscus]SBT89936.1 Putative Holin-X, holin superfamily III [Streptomyces sp. DI166]
MKRLDHLEHLDKHLADELAQVARETIREELREQTRRQRRRAMLYAASGTVALYAGAALALAVGLALAVALPGWAAALITAALLGVVAYLLRGAARPTHTGSPAAHTPATPPSGLGTPYPPMPDEDPEVPPTPANEIDPEQPHHRA